MKKISLNGHPHPTSAETIAALVAELGFPKGTAMIEHNGVALRPDEWHHPLAADDRVEVLRIVAGG